MLSCIDRTGICDPEIPESQDRVCTVYNAEMKFYLARRVVVGMGLTLFFLVTLGIYSYLNSYESIATTRMASHTNSVLFHIEQVYSSWLEIEAELLSYTIKPDSSFIQFLAAEQDSTALHMARLSELTSDNQAHALLLNNLRIMGRKKVAFVHEVVMARQESAAAARALIPSLRNDSLTNQIQGTIFSMRNTEEALLADRVKASEEGVTKFNTTFSVLLGVIVLVLFILFFNINRHLYARMIGEKALKKASDEARDLYDNSPCGYYSLDSKGNFVEINRTLASWLGYEKEDILNKRNFREFVKESDLPRLSSTFPEFMQKGFMDGLEFEMRKRNGTYFPVSVNATAIKNDKGEYVRSRSSCFDMTRRKEAEYLTEQANRELESFTYSVSHDLRAPLRSVHSYMRILHEDYAAKLDEEGNRLMNIVINNAKRMGQLIDDLLEFSRMGRTELQRANIKMQEMVEGLTDEFQEQEPEKKYKIIVHPLEDARADYAMVKQVWTNLISNSMKYSRKTVHPVIEIGSKEEEGKIIYFIKDNGVGFDMKYADKLFQVFQRLHRIQDFEGTGVGLALVNRIIRRHKGKIWAESQVNKGAAFYFFLGNQN